MNILVDICHPGQVHLLKNLIWELKKKNHSVIITLKNITAAKELLKLYGINFIDLGNKSDSILGKGVNQLKYNLKIHQIAKRYNINLGIGSSVTLAQVSKFTRMISFFLDDDDDNVEPLLVKFAHPFADYVISPDVLKGKRRKKNTIFYSGYHELAYLHPNYFSPDHSVLNQIGLRQGVPFFVMRFNAFKAHHDKGAKGLSLYDKRKLIHRLTKHGKVLITTERDIEPEFEQYKIKISPDKIHSLLYYATIFIGDSQTMTSEAAVLGTPVIRCNSFVGKISYLNEEEHKYGLTYGFLPTQSEKMFDKVEELLSIKNLKSKWQEKRKKLLSDKIDVTAFIVWLVDNYPKSIEIVKKNPDFPNMFR